MLPATQEEIDQVRSYFEGQAPDLKVEFIQKVYTENVLGHCHDVWDVHTFREVRTITRSSGKSRRPIQDQVSGLLFMRRNGVNLPLIHMESARPLALSSNAIRHTATGHITSPSSAGTTR